MTTYDAADGYVLLFGGATLPGGKYLSDTWTFKGGVWTNITVTAGTPPSPRVAYVMAYDAADGYVVLAGGQSPSGTQLADVWEFHSGQWSELSPDGLPISLQDPCGLLAAFDTTDNFTMFLAASCNNSPTGGTAMEYKGGSWTDPDLNATTGPKAPVPGYEEGTLANDPQLHGLIFFGGYDHTFVYSAGEWVDESSNLTGVPAPQIDAGLAFDPVQGGVLLFGGFRQVGIGNYPPPTAWFLTNTTWTNITTSPAPPAEHYGGLLVWDPSDNVSIWFAIGFNYTWSWGGSSPFTGLAILETPSPAGVGQSVSFSSTHVGGTPPYVYNWSFGDGGASALPEPTHVYATAGAYLVTLSLSDSTGGTIDASLQFSVSASPTPAILVIPTPTDAGVPVVFIAEIASGPGTLTYSWTFGDGTGSPDPSPVHTYPDPGTYTVDLTVTAPGGGTINSTIAVEVNPDLSTPIISATPLAPSLGQLVNFTVQESSGSAPYTYAWAFGDGATGGNLSAISHIFTTNGPFTTTVKVTDSADQSISGLLNLTVSLNFTVLGQWSAGAAPLSVGFTSQVQGGKPGYTYFWHFGDGGTSALADPTHSFSEPGSYQVEATVTDVAGNSAQAYWPLYVAPGGGGLSVSLTASPQRITSGETSVVTSAISGGSGGYTYSWSGQGGECLAESILIYRCSPDAFASSISVALSVKDGAGTVAVGQVTIETPSGPSGTSPPPGLGSGGWIALAAVAVLVVAALVVAMSRPGRRGPESTRLANPKYRVTTRGTHDVGPPGSTGTPGSGPPGLSDGPGGTDDPMPTLI